MPAGRAAARGSDRPDGLRGGAGWVAASNSAAFSGQCASPQPLEPATVGAVLRGRVRVTAGAGPDRQPRPTAGAACPCTAGEMHFTHSNSLYAVKHTITLFTQLNASKHLLRRITQPIALYATKLTLRILRGAPTGYAALRMHIHLNSPNTLRTRMLVTHINSS